MKIEYAPDNTKVINSFLLTSKKDIREEVECILMNRVEQGYKVSRTVNSYIREWKGHNRLYKWNISRSHTKDVDLNENNSILEEIIWLLIGW